MVARDEGSRSRQGPSAARCRRTASALLAGARLTDGGPCEPRARARRGRQASRARIREVDDSLARAVGGSFHS
jgi:hypothetical protein